MAETEITYSVEKTCPICKSAFSATKVRSKLRMVRQDPDLNIVYEQINPLYYSVWFCPHCGYAAPENGFTDIQERSGEQLREFLKQCRVQADFSGLRSREQAIAVYKLAIFYSETIQAKSSRLGGLYLRLAWLYREARDEKKELMAMEKALEYYENASYKEQFPIGNMNELTMDYLIARMKYTTGKIDEAASAFSRIINNPMAKSEKRISELSRDAWNEIKAKRKEQDDVVE